MSRYKITVKDYFSSAEREFKTCQVLEEYLPEDFAQADVLLHLRRAIEIMLKALWVVNGIRPDPHISDTCFLADTKVLKDPLPDELTEEICNAIDSWAEIEYEPRIHFDKEEYETAKRIYAGLKETAAEYIKNGEGNNPIIVVDKDDDETYHIPDDIKALITEEFGKEFTGQLFTVFGKNADDITSAWFEQIGMYCEGTRGWCTALEKAVDIIGCRELFEYYKALPWYDSDEFDGQLYTIIKGYHLFD